MSGIREKNSSLYWAHILVGHDGNAAFARFNDFVNLQESPAGFGDSSKSAVMDLLRNANMRCGKALWFGYGAPAGICGEQAFGGEVHVNTLGMFVERRQGLPRCPKHGGLDLSASAAIALMNNCKEAPEGLLADLENESD